MPVIPDLPWTADSVDESPGVVVITHIMAQAFQVAAEARSFLSSQGVDLFGKQQTKTKTALEYFSRNRNAAASA